MWLIISQAVKHNDNLGVPLDGTPLVLYNVMLPFCRKAIKFSAPIV